MASLHIDEAPESETTGHEWDGIHELNKPLPKWWLWTFYATIVWAIGYWLLMPAWPTRRGYTTGLLGYSSRGESPSSSKRRRPRRAEFRARRSPQVALATINNDPELLQFALAGGEAAFGDNCAPCHGRGAQGAFGYPNLRDDAWLWGGTLDAIQQTVQHGVRADDPETRSPGAQMPAFGKERGPRRRRRSATSRTTCCRSPGTRATPSGRARRQDLRRHLHALSRGARQGQPSAWSTEI